MSETDTLVRAKNLKSKKILIKILLIVVFVSVLYLLVRTFIKFPIDCMPRIGPEPIEKRLLKLLFKTKCVTF